MTWERKEKRLTDRILENSNPLPNTIDDVAGENLATGFAEGAENAARTERRERRSQRRSASFTPDSAPLESLGSDEMAVQESSESLGNGVAPKGERQARRSARRGAGRNPRAPRSEKSAAASDLTGNELTSEDPLFPVQDDGDTPSADEVPLIVTSGKSSARTTARARKKQQAAASAVDAIDEHPAIGALNRHLNMMMQQLTAAHRVIGRVAAERDALRQQLADLQGIPVEEIQVTSIGTATETTGATLRSTTSAAAEAEQPSMLARLNYFGGDDFELMKRRRQRFVIALVLVGCFIAVIARQNGWSMPSDISRSSLAALPFLGNLMTVFLAGWVLFRVVRVSSKGVRWVFPSEDRRRRRR
jgi:hypothetical protein